MPVHIFDCAKPHSKLVHAVGQDATNLDADVEGGKLDRKGKSISTNHAA